MIFTRYTFAYFRWKWRKKS